MSDAKHTPPGDASFRTSLLRNAAGAVGLVVVVAAAFWGIGSVGAGDGTPVAADGGADTSTEAPADDGAGSDDDAGSDDGAGSDETPDGDDAAEPDAGEDDAGEDEPDADGAGEAADGDEPSADDPDEGAADDGAAEDGSEADEGDSVERSVAPGDVTVQVLDGVKDDGGAAADGVADLLGGVGYDIIARNDALSYEVTTVLYNPGNEAAAQQVAADLGGAEVREQPGNLSTRVSLHVVVGRDRA